MSLESIESLSRKIRELEETLSQDLNSSLPFTPQSLPQSQHLPPSHSKSPNTQSSLQTSVKSIPNRASRSTTPSSRPRPATSSTSRNISPSLQRAPSVPASVRKPSKSPLVQPSQESTPLSELLAQLNAQRSRVEQLETELRESQNRERKEKQLR